MPPPLGSLAPENWLQVVAVSQVRPVRAATKSARPVQATGRRPVGRTRAARAKLGRDQAGQALDMRGLAVQKLGTPVRLESMARHPVQLP